MAAIFNCFFLQIDSYSKDVKVCQILGQYLFQDLYRGRRGAHWMSLPQDLTYCMSIYYFRHDHKCTGFRKLVIKDTDLFFKKYDYYLAQHLLNIVKFTKIYIPV